MSRFLDSKLNKLKPYTPGEQPKGMQNLIKLNTNESPFPPSPKVQKAVEDAVSNLNLYSDPNCTSTIRAISDFYCISEKNVMLGNGSDEILAFIFHGFCPDGAVFPDITYGFYTVFADMFGVKKEIISLDDFFNIQTDDYCNKKGTVFIANPNAPTGIFLPLSQIEVLLKQDESRLVVVDEAYIDFGGESAVNLLSKYKNLIVVQTFSKSRSLAGGRIGFAIASEELIADLNMLRFSFNPYNVNSLSLLAAREAINDKEYFENCRNEINNNRSFLTEKLRNLGFTVLESKANFVYAGKNTTINAHDYFEELRKKNIIVRYFPSGRQADFVRITVGTKEQMWILIEETTSILKESIK